ncbi:hypothetical protein JTB14_008774 [Gonioctena quinquepunctata]|nr:hypothetical protein JTB14_008774 [Gonioctena quinquepunctata]
MQQHPGRPVISQIGKLFGNAFMKATSVQTAVSGLGKTGVHPLNPEIFPDWMFEPADSRTPPRTPLRTLPTSPLRKPPSITTIPTKQFYANSTPSCSHTTQNFVVTPQQPKLNFGDTEKAAYIVKLNKKGRINYNEMTTRKDIKAKNPKKKDSSSSEETSVREKRQKYTKGRKIKKEGNREKVMIPVQNMKAKKRPEYFAANFIPILSQKKVG